MRKSSLGSLIVSVVVFASGCASSSSDVRVDQAAGGVPACDSFAWLPAENQAATLTEQRVRDAALAELQRKGYSVNAEKPECRITYLLSSYERPKQKPRVGVGAGGGSGGFGGGIGISIPVGKRDGQVGTFTLDVVDVDQNAQVWSGSIDASFESGELSQEEAQELVSAVLSRFPDPRR